MGSAPPCPNGAAPATDGPDDAPTSAEQVAEEIIAEDLLVEEVSIDGMCGVY